VKGGGETENTFDLTTRGPLTLRVRKRYEEEDELLAVLRDIHQRIEALRTSEALAGWLAEFEATDPDGAAKLRDELDDASRLFYQLRAGRAVA
jgi:hypothetical protein